MNKSTKYSVWVTLFSPSASNAGIIGGTQKTRSSWTSGKLEYIPINDGSQINFVFDARDDAEAYAIVTRLFNERNPRNRKPLSGKSYMRSCRELPANSTTKSTVARSV